MLPSSVMTVSAALLLARFIDSASSGTIQSPLSTIATEGLEIRTLTSTRLQKILSKPKVRKEQTEPPLGDESRKGILTVGDAGETGNRGRGQRVSAAATLEGRGSIQLLGAEGVNSNGGSAAAAWRGPDGVHERSSVALVDAADIPASRVAYPDVPSDEKYRKNSDGGSSRIVDRLLRWAFPPGTPRLWPARLPKVAGIAPPRHEHASNATQRGSSWTDREASVARSSIRMVKDRWRETAGLYEIEASEGQNRPSVTGDRKGQKGTPKWDAQKAETMMAQDLPVANRWFLSLVGVVVVFFISAPMLKAVYKVDPDADAIAEGGELERDYLAARGRPCWTIVILLLTPAIAVLCFLLTFLKAETLNVQLASDPESRHITSDGEKVVVGFIQSPGERAFEAGIGCVLSVTVACYAIFYQRFVGSVQITTGLLSLLSFRGATFSLAVAGMMEVAVVLMVPGLHKGDNSVQVSQQADLRNVILMLMVGVSEEFGKALSIICGTVLVRSALDEGAERSDAYACLWRCWRVLLESPRALMLAGLAAGFGFMTMENMMYLIEVASSPPMDFDDEINAEDTRLVLRLVRFATILIRVALNIHPWLAGITGARIAQYCFGNSRRTYPELTLAELSWVLAPSAVAHMFYDLVVLTAPGLVALIAPPIWFFASRWVFNSEWEKCRALEVDPTSSPPSDAVVEDPPTTAVVVNESPPT